MKTRIILFLLCLITLNVMGQGTITRQHASSSTHQSKPKPKPKPQPSQTHYKNTCKSCGTKFNGNFCPNCGQKATTTQSSVTKTMKEKTFTVNGVSFTMMPVQGGTFTMGATSEQGSDAYSDENPTHQVTLSSYYIGKYEVTQALWQAVTGSNPSKFKGDNLPVEEVSWDDCQTFIRELNSKTGKTFRLPTEAEWEFAARGGNKSQGYKYSGSDFIGNVAWYDDNSGSKTHPVGTKSPNELGLYDMSGNVYEWCSDWYGSYSSSSQTNPTGASGGSNRVCRGGCWYFNARYCRVSYRGSLTPDSRYNGLGLRLVLSEF